MRRTTGCSSFGRASALHAEGPGFDYLHLHDFFDFPSQAVPSLSFYFPSTGLANAHCVCHCGFSVWIVTHIHAYVMDIRVHRRRLSSSYARRHTARLYMTQSLLENEWISLLLQVYQSKHQLPPTLLHTMVQVIRRGSHSRNLNELTGTVIHPPKIKVALRIVRTGFILGHLRSCTAPEVYTQQPTNTHSRCGE